MEERVADCPLGAKCEEVKTEGNKQVLYRCPWHVKIRGLDPNTGAELDHWKCAIAWMPVLSVNNANETRKGAAAVESFRNEMIDQNNTFAQTALTLMNARPDPVRPALLYDTDTK